ncbi:hypothetical protein [Salipiger sp.]|uniref:hypothetical protein n=1 Tax=Salipiger sp. TaxID=2078585 RepID=UPI003A988256
MSFFGDAFDPRADALGLLDLVQLDTPDGAARFMLGVEGRFTDLNGNVWFGSQLLAVSGLESAINGVAPAGQATFSFIQDPAAPAVIEEILALGPDYLSGRAITFLVQPIASHRDFYAPSVAPRQWLRRKMRTLSIKADGPLTREISVGFEAWTEGRRTASRIALNTEGHAALLGGVANPSLEFIPTSDFQEEKLWS